MIEVEVQGVVFRLHRRLVGGNHIQASSHGADGAWVRMCWSCSCWVKLGLWYCDVNLQADDKIVSTKCSVRTMKSKILWRVVVYLRAARLRTYLVDTEK